MSSSKKHGRNKCVVDNGHTKEIEAGSSGNCARENVIKLSSLNPYIMCPLCNGYLVEATTVIDCLHTFCKSCLLKYFEENSDCPKCHNQIHQSHPSHYVAFDRTMQDIVYKLVPGMQAEEQRRREQFKKRHQLKDGRELNGRAAPQLPPHTVTVVPTPNATTVAEVCPNVTPSPTVNSHGTSAAEENAVDEGASCSPQEGCCCCADQDPTTAHRRRDEPVLIRLIPGKNFGPIDRSFVRLSAFATVNTVKRFLAFLLLNDITRYSDFDIFCNRELMGRDFSMAFIRKTRWRNRQEPLELTGILIQMDDKKRASLLSFLNLLLSDLGLEDCPDLKEARQFLPIFSDFVKTGQLRFMDSRTFSICSAFADIEAATGEQLVASLTLDPVEDETGVEVAKIFLALAFSLRVLHTDQFNAFMQRLDRAQARTLSEMVNSLYAHRRSAAFPFAQILATQSTENGGTGMPRKKLSVNAYPLNSSNLQIFSTPTKDGGINSSPSASPGKLSADEEEAAKQKIRSTELKARLKQLESSNSQLNEQLNVVQSDYNELELKYEGMRNTQARLQETIHGLNTKLKESQDESEMRRYDNAQLQRELKSTNERHTKAADKLAKETKDKDKEVQMLHRRLDDYVKQFAAKESLESRVKFLDQQMSNQQGMQRELRDDLERALNRANIAETELASLKKVVKNSTPIVVPSDNPTPPNDDEDSKDGIQNDNAPIQSSSAVSLQDELNSTLYHSLEYTGSDSLHNNELEEYNDGADTNMPIFASAVTDDGELADLRTRLDVLESQNRHLKQRIEDAKMEMESIRSSCSHSVMEKAVEVERLQQECEGLREELQKTRQKEVVTQERHKAVEDENKRLVSRVHSLEQSLDKAARVIEEYSTASETHCSAAELLQTQHELAKLQTENQHLLNKMDQFKHEATQEQRLITTQWFSAHTELLKARELIRIHGLGGSTNGGGSSSMTASSSSFDNNSHQHQSNSSSITSAVQPVQQQQQQQRYVSSGVSSEDAGRKSSNSTVSKIARSFMRRQLDTSSVALAHHASSSPSSDDDDGDINNDDSVSAVQVAP
ncbi:Polycomb group RING finger protein 3 [Globodera pallida]|nr:Polycomb group RING finger protein 3 [Globodera pallida]